MIMTEAIAIL